MVKIKGTTVDFTNAQASEHVAGSCVYISNSNVNLLLECGMSQSNNLERDYKENNEKFNFSVNKIDYVFVGHSHLDHIGRIPLLYKRGCDAKIIVPKGNRLLMLNSLKDSAYILFKNAKALGFRKNKTIEPMYEIGDVQNAMDHVVEYDFDKEYTLDGGLKFQFVNSGHIACAAQIALWITENNVTKKVAYTSDLGNVNFEKNYSHSFEPIKFADLLIGETTYGDSHRPSATASKRVKDLEKIKTIIDETRHDNGKIMIPVFALDRLPEMLTILYILYKDDPTFDMPVLVDSPLGLKHIKSYFDFLDKEQQTLLQEALDWKLVKQIGEYSESDSWASSNKSYVVLSSSGMCSAGRSMVYLPYLLKNYNNTIIFCGYCTENSIGWRIKNYKDNKTITINQEKYPVKCGVANLNSFSSHMQYEGLLEYYSSQNFSKIALVHGDMKTKSAFAADLKEEISKHNKSSKVVIVNKGTKFKL